jgi:hypothetical protein
MFRNDEQRARVCEALCAWMNKGPMWTEDGPTEQALAWQEESPLSSGERVLLGIAWACWNDSNLGPHFVELFRLDRERSRMVGELVIAMGSSGFDSWLRQWEHV